MSRQVAIEPSHDTGERYRLAARATDDIIWDWDLIANEVRWNEALTRRFGHAPADLITTVEWWEERIHPQDRSRALASIDEAIEGATEMWSAEYRFQRADGTYADVFDRGYLIRCDNGQSVRMVGAMLDWSERKLAEERLREGEENYRYTIELSPQMPWTADPDGRLLTISSRWLEWTGLTVEAALGDGWRGLIHPDDAPAVMDTIQHCISTGQPLDWQARVRRAASDYRWVRTRAYPRFAEDGQIIRWYGLTEDIDQQRATEQRLQRLQDEFQQVARASAMGTLASTLAHELNQPLTAIANYMAGCRRLLADHGPTGIEAVMDAMDGAAKAAVRAGEIVRRLRDLVSQGKVERQHVDLAALVKDACDVALGDMREKRIELISDIPASSRIVLVDRVQVQQVLVNLLRNAADAVADCQSRMIWVTAAPHGSERIMVRVEDSGPGVPPEAKRQLFSPFFSTKAGGMGVGLSISRSIVEAHGGELWVEDGPAGTAFCFTLPMAGPANTSSDSPAT